LPSIERGDEDRLINDDELENEALEIIQSKNIQELKDL
jgi:hypothetical protein